VHHGHAPLASKLKRLSRVFTSRISAQSGGYTGAAAKAPQMQACQVQTFAPSLQRAAEQYPGLSFRETQTFAADLVAAVSAIR
jgi:hypothetical protein